jgi:hypothetical protein
VRSQSVHIGEGPVRFHWRIGWCDRRVGSKESLDVLSSVIVNNRE